MIPLDDPVAVELTAPTRYQFRKIGGRWERRTRKRGGGWHQWKRLHVRTVFEQNTSVKRARTAWSWR